MRHAVGFPCASVGGYRKDRGLSKEMHGRGILIQICEDWSERFAGIELLSWCRVFGIHVDDEVRVSCEERHLAFCIATIGGMRLGLNKFTDREAIRGFFG